MIHFHQILEKKELKFLQPLLLDQEGVSHIPKSDEFLVELIENKYGNHLLCIHLKEDWSKRMSALARSTEFLKFSDFIYHGDE